MKRLSTHFNLPALGRLYRMLADRAGADKKGMKRIGIFLTGFALLAIPPGVSYAQMNPPSAAPQEKQAVSGNQEEGSGTEAAGPKMEKMEPGMMPMNCMKMMQQMMQGRMAVHGAEMGRKRPEPEIGISFFMDPFHRWMNLLMAHREALELTPEQLGRLDGAVTEHLKTAVRGEADIQSMLIELKYRLRGQTLNLQTIEDLLKKISDQQFNLLLEGVRLYDGILNSVLTEAQRNKSKALIGGPFPPPWQEMPDLPSPHPEAGSGSPEGAKMEEKAQEAHH